MTPVRQAPGVGTTPMEQVLYEVKKVVVGQDHFLERVLVALCGAQCGVCLRQP